MKRALAYLVYSSFFIATVLLAVPLYAAAVTYSDQSNTAPGNRWVETQNNSQYHGVEPLPDVLRVGIQKNLEPAFFMESFGPTMLYIRRLFPNIKFVTKEYTVEELLEVIQTKKVDLFFSDSGLYSFSHLQYGTTQIATRVAPYVADPIKASAMTVVVKNDSPIQTLEDVADKTIVADDSDNVGTWLVFESLLAQNNIDIEPIRKKALFTHYQIPGVALSVLLGRADVGVMPACQLEQLERTKGIASGALRVISPQSGDAFPCRRTSALYPDIVFAGTTTLSPGVLKTLMVSILTMPASREGYTWSIANDFSAIENIYRQLAIGPYSYLKQPNWKVLWDQYRAVFFMFLVGLAFWVFHTVRTKWLIDKRTQELDEANKKARHTQDRLAQMERAGIVSELSSMLVHEVRQPISTLITYAGGMRMYLQQKAINDPIILQTSDQMAQEAQRISDIVEHVRGYARATQHQRSRISLKELVDRATKTFSNSTAASEIDVQIKNTQSHCTLIVEHLEAELAIVNLMKNAASASHRSGAPQDRRIVIACDVKKDCAVISVTDFGPAISENIFANLSRPVQSLKSEGLGLGLSLVKNIMESHGGTLTFSRYSPDKGLIACLTFPLESTAGSIKE